MEIPAKIGVRQRRIVEALGEDTLTLSELRQAVPDMLRQHVHAAVSALERRGAVETWREDGEKHIAYVLPERSLQKLVEEHPMTEWQPHGRDLDPGDYRHFDYASTRDEDEEERTLTSEELRAEREEILSRPLPESPEEITARVMRDHVPLTAEEARTLMEGGFD